MTADELVNASKEIQEKWLKETKVDFKVDYEYVGCFVEEGQVDDDPGDVCTYSEVK